MTLWALLRVMEDPVWKRAVSLGVLGSVCVLTSWYYGLFSYFGIFDDFTVVFWKSSWLYNGVPLSMSIGLSAMVAISIVLGPVLSFRSSLSAENAIVTRDPEFVERSLFNHNITDLQAFFQLSKIPIPDLRTLYGEELMIIIYLGWVGFMSGRVWCLERTTQRRLAFVGVDGFTFLSFVWVLTCMLVESIFDGMEKNTIAIFGFV